MARTLSIVIVLLWSATVVARIAQTPDLNNPQDVIRVTRPRGEIAMPLFTMRGSSSYHTKSCVLGQNNPMAPLTASDFTTRSLDPCILCKPSGDPAVEELSGFSMYRDKLLFVAQGRTPVHAEPSAASSVVWTMQPLNVAIPIQLRPEWVRVAMGDVRGWVSSAGIFDLIPGTYSETAIRVATISSQTWPPETKVRILNGEIAIGFTVMQVQLAMGSPARTVDDETVNGRITVMSYPGRTVTLVNGVVTSIQTIR